VSRRGVLFDFDGTLVDTFPGIVEGVHRMRTRLGAPRLKDDDVRRHIGWGIRNLIGQCHPECDSVEIPNGEPLPVAPDELERSVALFRHEYSRILVSLSHIYAGIEPLCAWLGRENVALAVVSNKPDRFVRQIMAAVGLADAFELVLGADTMSALKPDPASLREAIEKLGIDSERCVMVGDSRLDIEAAKNARIASCAVTWGLGTEADLASVEPTTLVDSTHGLADWLLEFLEPIEAPPGRA